MTLPITLHFDDQIFNRQRHGGISRYFTELMAGIEGNPRLGLRLVGPKPWTPNAHLLESGRGRWLPPSARLARPMLDWMNRWGTRSLEPQIVHHTYYVRRYLSWFPRPRLRVVTIHDMIPEIRPDFYPKGNPHLAKQEYVQRADLLVCISETTRLDLTSVYGELSAPVVVIPHGVSSTFRPGLEPLSSLPSPYLLFVGKRSRYKDFDVLVEAVAQLAPSEDLQVVAVGGGEMRRSEWSRLEEMGIADRVTHATLNEFDLAKAYANAAAFIFPSQYEGFGLPTLEAMASGCPTVVADSSVHRETAGTAAVFFDAGNADALSERIKQVLSDQDLRSRLVEAGLIRSAQFSWGATVSATAAAYTEHLG